MAKKEKKEKKEKAEKKKKEKKPKQPVFMYDKVISALGGIACLFLLFILAGIVLLFVFHSVL